MIPSHSPLLCLCPSSFNHSQVHTVPPSMTTEYGPLAHQETQCLSLHTDRCFCAQVCVWVRNSYAGSRRSADGAPDTAPAAEPDDPSPPPAAQRVLQDKEPAGETVSRNRPIMRVDQGPPLILSVSVHVSLSLSLSISFSLLFHSPFPVSVRLLSIIRKSTLRLRA